MGQKLKNKSKAAKAFENLLIMQLMQRNEYYFDDPLFCAVALFNRSQRFLGDTSVVPLAAMRMVLAVPSPYSPAKSLLSPATQEHLNKVFYRQQKSRITRQFPECPHLRGADFSSWSAMTAMLKLSPLRGDNMKVGNGYVKMD